MRTVRQQRARGVVAAVAGATLLVSMLALPGGASATPVRAARFPQCTAAALDVWLNTAGVGSAGRLTYELNFTNLSSRTCTLFGYPGVRTSTSRATSWASPLVATRHGHRSRSR